MKKNITLKKYITTLLGIVIDYMQDGQVPD